MTVTMDRPTEIPANEVTYRRFEDDVSPLTEADIPLRPENRKKTDKAFTYVLAASITVAIILLLVAVGIGSKYASPRHSEPDMEINIGKVGWKLVLTSFVSLGLTIIMAVLYRHATSFVVWGILILSWAYFFILTIVVWCIGKNIVLQITFTVVTLVLLCVLIFMKDKVRLVTMLFKEATKATFNMPAVFTVAAASILLLLVVASIYFPATLYLAHAGTSTRANEELSSFGIGSIIFNTIITIWICEFLVSVQYLIVSGAVTKWYFTRNKELLGDPVYTSFHVTMKYHIGTAALGSLIITIVAVIRAIIRSMIQNPRFRALVNCCLAHIEGFIRFFTKNAFIVTAMHGTGFIPSGKQAVKLLTLNICNTITINSLGDFVLTMSSVLIVGLTAVISYFILDLSDKSYTSYEIYCLIVFVIAIALICCCTVLGTFETSFSTLFLCVCQDFLINNGNDKPYAMTRDLMEFLDDSKRVFAKTIEKKNLPKI